MAFRTQKLEEVAPLPRGGVARRSAVRTLVCPGKSMRFPQQRTESPAPQTPKTLHSLQQNGKTGSGLAADSWAMLPNLGHYPNQAWGKHPFDACIYRRQYRQKSDLPELLPPGDLPETLPGPEPEPEPELRTGFLLCTFCTRWEEAACIVSSLVWSSCSLDLLQYTVSTSANVRVSLAWRSSSSRISTQLLNQRKWLGKPRMACDIACDSDMGRFVKLAPCLISW
jgi:hypothetical protein